jgi:hypothetical protein
LITSSDSEESEGSGSTSHKQKGNTSHPLSVEALTAFFNSVVQKQVDTQLPCPVNSYTRPAVNPIAKPAAKPAVNPIVKPVAKPAAKPAVSTTAKPLNTHLSEQV